MIARQADDFIRLCEETYERRNGPLAEKLLTDDFEHGDRPAYPRGIKYCARCGKPSKRELVLDGRNYYCGDDPECHRARIMYNDRKNAMQ